MQKLNLYLAILALALLGLSVFVVYRNNEMQIQLIKLQQTINEQKVVDLKHNITHKEDKEEEFPLVEYMSKMLYYTQKVGMAGKYQNWDLAGFYVHELEESVEVLADSHVVYDGVEVSNLAKNLEPLIEQLETHVKEGNAVEFPKTYQTLIRNCNNCHISANKPYIVVEAPQKDFDGQRFKK